MQKTYWFLPVAALLLLMLPMLDNGYVMAIASRIVIFAILAMSLDLILGYAGLISFGHAAYFGMGAYVVGISVYYGITNGWVHFLLAPITAGIFAGLVAMLVVRIKGIYFIMVTLAIAQMAFYLAVGLPQMGGDDGMSLASRSDFGSILNLSNPSHFYYLSLMLLLLISILCNRLVNSRFGLVLSACRQNETRVQALGYSVYWYKVTGFAIAGAIAGLAGALIVNLNAYVSPNFIDWKISAIIIMMLVIGGVGRLYGAIFGAATYLILEEVATHYTSHWMAIFGPLLVIFALYWHQGIYGMLFGSAARK